MVFSSTTFLIAFLPVTLIAYYVIGVKLTKNITVKNIILLLASLVFYAWGEPLYIVLMVISILFNYTVGRAMASSRETGNSKRVKAQFIFAIVFNLGMLGFFKYIGFLFGTVNSVFGTDIQSLAFPLPVGISFYTFQILSYIIDLYRGNIEVQKNPISFALYISLFPQLIAGPIVKYKDIAKQLSFRKENADDFSRGITRFTVGLAKKLIFANTLGAVYTIIQNGGTKDLSVVGAWIGIICYTLQIYFDFSGYSDMAIGLGGMFGFRFNENFRYPYIATSVTDFWRRWHISLSTWFKEYVYIPLGGNRRKTPRVILNLMIVWMLTGLWHGAAWNFVLWGVFYGVLLILEKYVLAGVLEKIPTPVRYILTMLCVMVGWVLFSSPSLAAAGEYLGVMFGGAEFINSQAIYIFSANFIVIILGAFCATPLYRKALRSFSIQTIGKLKMAAYPLLFILCMIFMISETYNPFLYFRF